MADTTPIVSYNGSGRHITEPVLNIDLTAEEAVALVGLLWLRGGERDTREGIRSVLKYVDPNTRTFDVFNEVLRRIESGELVNPLTNNLVPRLEQATRELSLKVTPARPGRTFYVLTAEGEVTRARYTMDVDGQFRQEHSRRPVMEFTTRDSAEKALGKYLLDRPAVLLRAFRAEVRSEGPRTKEKRELVYSPRDGKPLAEKTKEKRGVDPSLAQLQAAMGMMGWGFEGLSNLGFTGHSGPGKGW